MPRHGHGLAMRTHRVRPSEKITFRVISGFPRKAVLPWVPPAEGRAPHAHNDGIGLAGACPHLATRYSFAPDDHVMPRLASGLATRARRPRPSEKTTFRVISDLPPVGHLALDGPPRGGAGSARKPKETFPSPTNFSPVRRPLAQLPLLGR